MHFNFSFQIDQTTRQRLGIDVQTISKENHRKASKNKQNFVLDLNILNNSKSDFNGKYKLLQKAFGPETCCPIDWNACLSIPLPSDEWEIHRRQIESLLKTNGSPEGEVEFIKSEFAIKDVNYINYK